MPKVDEKEVEEKINKKNKKGIILEGVIRGVAKNKRVYYYDYKKKRFTSKRAYLLFKKSGKKLRFRKKRLKETTFKSVDVKEKAVKDSKSKEKYNVRTRFKYNFKTYDSPAESITGGFTADGNFSFKTAVRRSGFNTKPLNKVFFKRNANNIEFGGIEWVVYRLLNDSSMPQRYEGEYLKEIRYSWHGNSMYDKNESQSVILNLLYLK